MSRKAGVATDESAPAEPIPLADVAKAVPLFTGTPEERVRTWVDRLNAVLDNYHVAVDSRRGTLLIHFVSSNVYTHLSTLGYTDGNWKKATDGLVAAYGPQGGDGLALLRVQQAKQGQGEDVMAFASKFSSLVSDILNAKIADFVLMFTMGLADATVRDQLLVNPPEAKTFASYVETASRLEAVRRAALANNAPVAMAVAAVADDGGQYARQRANGHRPPQDARRDNHTIICRRCKRRGHIARDCRAPAPVYGATGNFSTQFLDNLSAQTKRGTTGNI